MGFLWVLVLDIGECFELPRLKGAEEYLVIWRYLEYTVFVVENILSCESQVMQDQFSSFKKHLNVIIAMNF